MSHAESVKSFLADRTIPIFIYFATLIIGAVFGIALHIDSGYLILIVVLSAIAFIIALSIDYLRRYRYYHSLFTNLSTLDRAYLVLETLEDANFYDGKILQEALYTINKSMQEEVGRYAESSREFQEYIEMWIHEVKTPLATLMLLNAKSKTPLRSKISTEIQRIDDYVEQVLYFARAENAERDYLIAQVPLIKLVNIIANRYQNTLRAKNINFITKNLNVQVSTDAKWLEFILGQIIGNSIKYGATEIKITAIEKPDHVHLKIQDNGIGISEKDLPRVFEKSFTGQNGRSSTNTLPSTGMGLYIAKNLCDRLGHKLSLSSMSNNGTTVELVFQKSKFYEVANRETH